MRKHTYLIAYAFLKNGMDGIGRAVREFSGKPVNVFLELEEDIKKENDLEKIAIINIEKNGSNNLGLYLYIVNPAKNDISIFAVINPTRPSFMSRDAYIIKIPIMQIILFHLFLFSNIIKIIQI